MYQELGLGGGYTFKSDLGRQRAEVSVGTTWEKTLLGTRMLGEYIIGRTMPAPAIPHEKPHTGAAARENPRDPPFIAR